MPLVVEMQRISPSVWEMLQDSSGKILDEYSVKKWTFHEGICPEARAEVWKFLLGYYPFLSTREEREAIEKEKRLEYHRLLDSWQCGVMPDNLGEYIRVIGKDSVRTDRSHASFSGNGPEAMENIETLNRILTTYCVYNPQLGYVQGMNEYLAPLLLVLGNEHQAFWCLTEALSRMSSVFSDLTLSQPLTTLARLCYYADTQLHNHIKSIHGDDEWMFCYRGVLLNFKREFSMEDIYSLWEIIWCNHLTKHFQLFVGVAILVHHKQEVFKCKTVEALMQFAMGFTCDAPLTPVLTIARALAEQLKGDEYCPHELRYLVSDEGCAPPPLVGFVRARQKFSTLYSNKISRSNIWKSLFGDTSVQPITSPFMLSPSHAPHITSPTTTHTPSHPHVYNDPRNSSYPVSAHTPTTNPPTIDGYPKTQNSSLQNQYSVANTHHLQSSSAHVADNSTSRPGSLDIGPPPKLGFVPRSLFARNSEPKLEFSGEEQGHTGFVQQNGTCASNTTHHFSNTTSYALNTTGYPSNTASDAFRTTALNTTAYAPNTTSNPLNTTQISPAASNTHFNCPPYNHVYNGPLTPPCRTAHTTWEDSTNSGHTKLTNHSHAQTNHGLASTTRLSHLQSPVNSHSSYEGLRSRTRPQSCVDAIHYDHRNGTISGGVFDTQVPTHDLISGAEFDDLRSEPSLY